MGSTLLLAPAAECRVCGALTTQLRDPTSREHAWWLVVAQHRTRSVTVHCCSDDCRDAAAAGLAEHGLMVTQTQLVRSGPATGLPRPARPVAVVEQRAQSARERTAVQSPLAQYIPPSSGGGNTQPAQATLAGM